MKGTSALPTYFGLAYLPLAAGLLVHWKPIHAFSCSTDISHCSRADLALELVDGINYTEASEQCLCLQLQSDRRQDSWNSLSKRLKLGRESLPKHCSNLGSSCLHSEMMQVVGHAYLLCHLRQPLFGKEVVGVCTNLHVNRTWSQLVGNTAHGRGCWN